MELIIRQLDQVRRRSRRLLTAQVAMSWLGGVVAVLIAAGAGDYVLHLPPWMRLALGIAAAGFALGFLGLRLRRATRFRPSLSDLALRAERLYPQLSGFLASGIAFASDRAAYAEPASTSTMADATIAAARERAADLPLRRLIDTRRTWHTALGLLIVLLFTTGVVAAAPLHSVLALKRWFDPLGAHAWPKRTEVRSLVDRAVCANDTPLPLEAEVMRGYRPGMRVRVHYHLVDEQGAAGPTQTLIMTEQKRNRSTVDDGASAPAAAAPPRRRFVRLVEIADGSRGATAAASRWSSLSFHFEAGDDQTEPQSVRLVARPGVIRVEASVTPPAYAAGLVDAQIIELQSLSDGAGPVRTIAALTGSQATVRFHVSGDVAPPDDWSVTLPGWAASPGALFGYSEAVGGETMVDGVIEARLEVSASIQSLIHLVDRHGLASANERMYRIEAMVDQPPSVSIVAPAHDESVLETAVIPLEGAARDDVGVEHVRLESRLANVSTASEWSLLAEQTGRSRQLGVEHDLDLSSMGLEVGQSIALTAWARDVFDLGGPRHEVRSNPRMLHIIDVATLTRQIHTELAGVRRQAVRIEAGQRLLMESETPDPLRRQRNIGRRLDGLRSQAREQIDRIARNRLDPIQAESLLRLLHQSEQLLNKAGTSSRSAQEQLERAKTEPKRAEAARQASRGHQKAVRDALNELSNLLDQSDDLLTMQLQLRELISAQKGLADATRKRPPGTLGEKVDNLSRADRHALRELADRQSSLAGKSGSLVAQMQSTSQALHRHGANPREQSAAAALAEATSIAQRQGLQENMRRAAELTEKNRLAESGSQQDRNVEILERMLEQFERLRRNEQEMLRRHLLRLVEAIESLVKQQKAQLARVNAKADLPALAGAMGQLWRNTLDVAALAAGAPQTRKVSASLGQAAGAQTMAVKALRDASVDNAAGHERVALAKLEEALKMAQQLSRNAGDKSDQDKRQELRKAYLKMAARQRELRRQMAPQTRVVEPTRREDLALRQIARGQGELRDELGERREQVEKTLVFLHQHDRTHQVAVVVVEAVEQGDRQPAILDDQDVIASTLESMADALKSAQRDDPFSRPGASGGGGGGGGGGGDNAGPVPPVAELKLLRGAQEAVYDRTRRLEKHVTKAGDAPPPKARWERLGAEQRDLAELGQKLQERLERPPPQAVPNRDQEPES